MMKIHKTKGCPWADGSIQMADTDQTDDWGKVTCGHCLRRHPRAEPRAIGRATVWFIRPKGK